MPLVKPALANAVPGKPVTAQAWNAIVDALSGLYDAVAALGGGLVTVQVSANGVPMPDATIVAVPLGGDRALTAVGPYPGVTSYTVAGVTSGSWNLHVAAAGYVAQTIAVTVPAAAPVVVNLVKDGVDMPDLFGKSTTQAIAALTAKGIQVDVIFDVTGDEIPKVSVPAESANVPVLLQDPPAGSVIKPATQRARLVIAAAFKQESTVVMPNLSGLSLSEATKALTTLGLKVGKITIKK